MLEIRHAQSHETLKASYEWIYEEIPIQHTDSFYRWILKLLSPKPGTRLLDVACGQGRLAQMAAKQGIAAYGIDLSVQAVQHGRSRAAALAAADGQYIPFGDALFDYVTNIGSLEHYMDPAAGIRDMARVMTRQARCCILLPNTFGLLGTVLHACHTGRTADDGQPIQRYAARYEWQDLLAANGLEVIRTYKYECEPPTSMGDLVGYLRRPKALVRLMLTPFLPTNLANSFVYICQKAISSDGLGGESG